MENPEDFVKNKIEECLSGIAKSKKFLNHKDKDTRDNARARIKYFQSWLDKVNNY